MLPSNSKKKKKKFRKIASAFYLYFFSCYSRSPALPPAVRKDTALPSLQAIIKISTVRLSALCLSSTYLSLV